MSERDIYEVANQLGGYVGPTTPDDLAEWLLRESGEAAKLADEIVRQRALLSSQEAEIERLTKERDHAIATTRAALKDKQP